MICGFSWILRSIMSIHRSFGENWKDLGFKFSKIMEYTLCFGAFWQSFINFFVIILRNVSSWWVYANEYHRRVTLFTQKARSRGKFYKIQWKFQSVNAALKPTTQSKLLGQKFYRGITRCEKIPEIWHRAPEDELRARRHK